jgi:hypothetical protein
VCDGVAHDTVAVQKAIHAAEAAGGGVVEFPSGTGVLGLKYPPARSFPTPSIANVASLVTSNIGVQDLVVEGAEPLAVTEAFGSPLKCPSQQPITGRAPTAR